MTTKPHATHASGPRRVVVSSRVLTPAEKFAANLLEYRSYYLLELACGHYIVRKSVQSRAFCGHCAASAGQ